MQRLGLRLTAPRLGVLNLLRQHGARHWSAEDIYRHLQTQAQPLSLPTIYRTLSQLESGGLVKRHAFGEGKAVYELDDGEHHDHLVCLRCGRVDEFQSDSIEALQEQMAARHGYALADHHLVLYGICPLCHAATAAPATTQQGD